MSAWRKPLLVTGRTVLVLVSAVILGTFGVLWNASQALTNLGSSQAISPGKPKAPDGSQNILLLGLTTRKDANGQDLPQDILDKLQAGNGLDAAHSPDHKDHTGGYNTNTMIVLHVPNDGTKATGISVPRDDYVTFVDGPLLGNTKGKIKEAYGWAKEQEQERLYAQGERDQATLEFKSREAGRKSTITNLESLLQVHIDHFAEISLVGFYDLATALHGVDVCLKNATKDSASGANFIAGPQHLDGKQALAFVRQRNGLPGDDLGRESRQQAFLASVASKLKQDGVFGSLGEIQSLIEAAKKDVVFDQDLKLLDLAQQGNNLNPSNIIFHTLPIKGAATDPYDGDINLIDIAQMRAAVQAWINPAPATPSTTTTSTSSTTTPPQVIAGSGSTVDVRNGSPVDHAAADLVDALSTKGFTAGEHTTVPKQSVSEITYGSGAKEDATKLASLLGITKVSPSTTASAGHVRIYLGKDYSMPTSLQGASGAGKTVSSNVPPPTEGSQGGAVKGDPNKPQCVD